jgi:hypothetical protein
VAMPVKLPAPDLGTEEQPGPKSAVVDAGADAAAEEAGIEDAGAEEAGAAADEDPLELHAVAVRATAATPQAASTRYFMVSPFKWAAVS